MIGRENTGTLSTNHMRAFRPSFSKAETGFNSEGVTRNGDRTGPTVLCMASCCASGPPGLNRPTRAFTCPLPGTTA
jgi:hypothetical protein